MTVLANPMAYPVHVASWRRPFGDPGYRVTNPFGGVDLVNPGQRHSGLDIGNFRENDTIRAPVACSARGITHTDGARGVLFDLGGGWVLELWHLNRYVLPEDWVPVVSGQAVGVTGSTGKVVGAHTHIELKQGGSVVDPAPFLPMVEREALDIPGATAGPRYVDVPLHHPFYWSIERISAAGFMSGKGGSRFAPDDALTRGEFAAVLDRVLKDLER